MSAARALGRCVAVPPADLRPPDGPSVSTRAARAVFPSLDAFCLARLSHPSLPLSSPLILDKTTTASPRAERPRTAASRRSRTRRSRTGSLTRAGARTSGASSTSWRSLQVRERGPFLFMPPSTPRQKTRPPRPDPPATSGRAGAVPITVFPGPGARLVPPQRLAARGKRGGFPTFFPPGKTKPPGRQGLLVHYSILRQQTRAEPTPPHEEPPA